MHVDNMSLVGGKKYVRDTVGEEKRKEETR